MGPLPKNTGPNPQIFFSFCLGRDTLSSNAQETSDAWLVLPSSPEAADTPLTSPSLCRLYSTVELEHTGEWRYKKREISPANERCTATSLILGSRTGTRTHTFGLLQSHQ